MFAAAQKMHKLLALVSLAGCGVMAQNSTINPNNFTIINGQIFTPGLAIVDAPQPNTPLGGGLFKSHRV